MSAPENMSRDAVADWLYREFIGDNEPFRYDKKDWQAHEIAEAVIALVDAKTAALRGEVATLRGARSAEDVREMLCEASCVDVTDARCARIWSLLEHPATTMTTLAVIADERGESYAKARAEVAALQARLAAAEARADGMERAGAEQARRADENAEWAKRAEAEAERARGLRVEENIVVEAAILWAERRSDDLSSAVNLLEAVNALLRKRAHLASRPEGEVADGR